MKIHQNFPFSKAECLLYASMKLVACFLFVKGSFLPEKCLCWVHREGGRNFHRNDRHFELFLVILGGWGGVFEWFWHFRGPFIIVPSFSYFHFIENGDGGWGKIPLSEPFVGPEINVELTFLRSGAPKPKFICNSFMPVTLYFFLHFISIPVISGSKWIDGGGGELHP